MSRDLVSMLADLKEEEALELVRNRLNANDDPLDILGDTRRAMEVVGRRFADGEYFMPELVYSGEILKEITAIVKPQQATQPATEH